MNEKKDGKEGQSSKPTNQTTRDSTPRQKVSIWKVLKSPTLYGVLAGILGIFFLVKLIEVQELETKDIILEASPALDSINRVINVKLHNKDDVGVSIFGIVGIDARGNKTLFRTHSSLGSRIPRGDSIIIAFNCRELYDICTLYFYFTDSLKRYRGPVPCNINNSK